MHSLGTIFICTIIHHLFLLELTLSRRHIRICITNSYFIESQITIIFYLPHDADAKTTEMSIENSSYIKEGGLPFFGMDEEG